MKALIAALAIAMLATPALAFSAHDDETAYEGAMLNYASVECGAALSAKQAYALETHQRLVDASDTYNNAAFHYHSQFVEAGCSTVEPMVNQ